MTINFRKMHGLGNDFVVFDDRANGTLVLSPPQRRYVADRHLGIGCDQIAVMKPGKGKADVYLELYNADGGVVEACGNASRCVADIVMNSSGHDTCIIETMAGFLHCRRVGDKLIEADMGEPSDIANVTIQQCDGITVNMGNPHCVFFVDDVMAIDLEKIGPTIEHDMHFPNRTNVEFVQILSPSSMRMRVWERGAGVTLACGTGACATAVAAAISNRTSRKTNILLDEGTLTIEWRESDNHVLMTGPVTYVFSGTLDGFTGTETGHTCEPVLENSY